MLNPESFAGRRFLSEWREGTQTNNQTIPAFQDFVRFKDFFVDLSLIIEIIYVKRDTKMEFLVVEPLRSGNGGYPDLRHLDLSGSYYLRSFVLFVKKSVFLLHGTGV